MATAQEKGGTLYLRFREWGLQKAFCLIIKPRLDSNIFFNSRLK